MALFTGIQHLCTFSIVAPLFYHVCQMFGRRRTPSARPFLLMFRIDRPIARISSSLVSFRVPRSGYFTVAKRSSSHGLISGEYGGCSRISHCQHRKRYVTAAVWLLSLSWRMIGFSATSVVAFSWVHVITTSSAKWKNHCDAPGSTQEMNLSML